MIWPVSWPFPATTRTSPASKLADGRPDGLGAIADLARTRRACHDLGADRGGIFGARIVVGDDHHVGLVGGDPSHDRPLAAIAVAAAAEHADEPARGEGTQGIEHMRKRVGLVGVVDDAERAVDFADRSSRPETPLRARQCRRAHRSACASPSTASTRPAGEERVLDLERAEQRKARLDAFGRMPRPSVAGANPSGRASTSCSVVAVLPVVSSVRPRRRSPLRGRHPHKARPH